MTDRLNLPLPYRRIVEALLREHVPDAEVWAYGSCVTGENREGSDLDLVVRGPELKPLGDGFFQLVEAIEDSYIPILVQTHDWARLPESFHAEIEREYLVLQERAKDTTRGEWRELPFSEAVQINPAVKLDRGAVYPFVDMAAISADSRSVYSSDKREFKGSGSRFQDSDTLMARITPCLENGKVARYHASGGKREAHGSTEFIVIRGRPNVTDNDFVHYLTKWEEVHNAIGQMTGTSGRQRVPVDSLDHLTVPIPPFSEQRTIAHILGTLDDKIELNRRMNETLEEMARALFKSWFVDFLPVRAKQRARTQTGDPVRAKAALESSAAGGSRQAASVSPQARPWGEIKHRYSRETLERSRSLRQDQTDAEGLLWLHLRNKQLDGYKFRRQQPIGPYIADFACLSRNLLIELDGGQHVEGRAYDEKRDAFLQEQGYRVLRFWNHEVFQNCIGVLERIYEVLISAPPHQQSPAGSPSANSPQGGSDWTVERARTYLNSMDKSIVDLFPDRLVDSELGEIPEGWEVKALGEVANQRRSGASPEHIDPDSPYIGLEHMPQRSIALSEWNNADGLVSGKFRFEEDDILFGKLRPYFHKVGVAPVDGVCSTDIVVVSPISAEWFGFVLEHTSSKEFVDYTDAASTGTRMPRTKWKDMAMYKVALPGVELAGAFSEIIQPWIKSILSAIHESHFLAQQRDALLPKLVSGEVRLRNSGNYTENRC